MACDSGPSIRFLSFVKYSAENIDWSGVVEVPDGQGLLQMGKVVVTSKEGVLVDFFCKGQPPRLVPYGRMFHFWENSAREIEDAEKIQVLVRMARDVPFTWFAAKLLDTDTHLDPPRLVEVELELEGVVVKELVHTSQIRNAPAQNTGIVEKNYFVGFGAHVRCCRPSPKENCLDAASRSIESSLEKGLERCGGFSQESSVNVVSDGNATCGPVSGLSSLPGRLLGEIFQFLDSVERVRLRRVCPLWDCVLGMEGLFVDVWVCLKHRYNCPFKWSISASMHAVLLCMTTLVTKSTRWLIIAGSDVKCGPRTIDQHNEHIEEPLRLIADVARYFTLPFTGKLNCVIYQCRWYPSNCLEDGVEELAALCKKVALVCGSLTWKNCTFKDHGCVSVLPVRKGSVTLASGTLQELFRNSAGTLQADLWEMLDINAPAVNLEEISKWLAEEINRDSDDVEFVLGEFQIPDPRLANQAALYRGDELTAMIWGNSWERKLDVRRLTRLTLWALSGEMEAPIWTCRTLEESNEDDGIGPICDSSDKCSDCQHRGQDVPDEDK